MTRAQIREACEKRAAAGKKHFLTVLDAAGAIRAGIDPCEGLCSPMGDDLADAIEFVISQALLRPVAPEPDYAHDMPMEKIENIGELVKLVQDECQLEARHTLALQMVQCKISDLLAPGQEEFREAE